MPTSPSIDAVHPVDGARILFVRAHKVEHFLLPREPLGSWELLRGRGRGRGQHNLTHLPNLPDLGGRRLPLRPSVTGSAIPEFPIPFKPVFEAKKRSPQNSLLLLLFLAALVVLGSVIKVRVRLLLLSVRVLRARVVPLLDARPPSSWCDAVWSDAARRGAGSWELWEDGVGGG